MEKDLIIVSLAVIGILVGLFFFGNGVLFSVVPTPATASGYGVIVPHQNVIDAQSSSTICDSPGSSQSVLFVTNVPADAEVDGAKSYVIYQRNNGVQGRPSLGWSGHPYEANVLVFAATSGIGADSSGNFCAVIYHIEFKQPEPPQQQQQPPPPQQDEPPPVNQPPILVEPVPPQDNSLIYLAVAFIVAIIAILGFIAYRRR